MPTVSRRGLWRGAWAVVVALVAALPYVINALATPDGHRFTWILFPFPDDALAYQAWGRQAMQGHWIFRVLYTPTEHAPFLFHPYFLIGGWLARFTGLELGIVYVIMKTVGVLVFFMALLFFCSEWRFEDDETDVALILIGATSGLGWLFLPGMPWAGALRGADTWLVDINTFWSFMWNPLFPWSLALLLATLGFWRRGGDGDMRAAMVSGVFATLLVVVHPYHGPLVVVYPIFSLLVYRSRAALKCVLSYFLTALPGIAWVVYADRMSPVALRHDTTGAMTSPNMLTVLVGWGIPAILAVLSFVLTDPRTRRRLAPVGLWLTLSIFLAYTPFWFQRKFFFGTHVAVCLLAGVGAVALWKREFWARVPASRALMTAAAVTLMLPSTVYVWAVQRAAARANLDGQFYLSSDRDRALAAVAAHVPENELVLATPATSGLVPALTGRPVFWGHWAMGMNREAVELWAREVFEGPRGSVDDKKTLFWALGARWVLADGWLKTWLDAQPADFLEGCETVFDSPTARLVHRLEK